VVIQTYCPPHYAIQAAAHQDYQQFFEQEINMRERHHLPPFARLIELTLRGSNAARVQQVADRLAGTLRRKAARTSIALLGPAPHRIPRLRRIYRMCILMKGEAIEPMVQLVRQVLTSGRTFERVPVTVDVDPL